MKIVYKGTWSNILFKFVYSTLRGNNNRTDTYKVKKTGTGI